MSQDLMGGSSVGQSSKWHEKIAASIEECVREIRDTVAQLEVSNDEAQMDVVFQILEQDGIGEETDLHAHAVILCKNPLDRRAFSLYKTPAGRADWIRNSWRDRMNKMGIKE
jgi:hypothetical protein